LAFQKMGKIWHKKYCKNSWQIFWKTMTFGSSGVRRKFSWGVSFSGMGQKFAFGVR